MATVSAMYNTLPSLEDAEKRFIEREKVFATVGNLLAMYENAFAEDEIMLARDNISQPENASLLKEYYPERWPPNGEAYEFTTKPTISPPADLMKEFNDLTSHIGVLGLYYVANQHEGRMIEHSEGRKNILNPFTDADEARAANHTETAWNLGRGDPVTMTCVIVCDTISTRSGGSAHKSLSLTLHMRFITLLRYFIKDTKSHLQSRS
ncbi:MAG: hypothetical protein M1835_004379 [Candelina submexicana]|nr:MAG: hypothetical protein M1835_004379 [Candelina submexicana]